MTTHQMVKVSCNCKTCRANAATLGVQAPLTATVTEAFLAKCGAHTAAHTANDPIFGAAFRAQQAVCAETLIDA